MGEDTLIEWATYSWNPWIGCTEVSPGCAHCYAAKSLPAKFQGIKWGKGQPRHKTAVGNWQKPHLWNAEAEGSGVRPRVFPSLCDPFDWEVPEQWFDSLLITIHNTPCLDWLLLTKRPQNLMRRLEDMVQNGTTVVRNLAREWRDGKAPENVWLGVSVEDQVRADERIPILLGLPAKVRFLSVEPLLGPVDLYLSAKADGERIYFRGPNTGQPVPRFDWVIVGGESDVSGQKARTCELNWISSVIGQCAVAGVPCFVKQLGSRPLMMNGRVFGPLAHKKGGDMEEWPEGLRVREFPVVEDWEKGRRGEEER